MSVIRRLGVRTALNPFGASFRGSSLLEVLVALSLLATSMLGAAAVQLAALRGADEQARREHASWIAASVAEGMRSPEAASTMFERSQSRAESLLPGARMSIVAEHAPGVGMVAMQWPRGAGAFGEEQALGYNGCPVAERIAPAHCIALPFATHQ
jgi:hypothetical protein